MVSKVMQDMIKSSSSWAVQEALRILEHINWKTPDKGYVLFETGYGPSGLPHIGTFGEVKRTKMIMFAFSQIAPQIPTRLFCVSDDMDGMRKVPTNVPMQEEMQKYIGMPLNTIPDPYKEKQSYAHYMNAKLNSFLDACGFDYEFISSAECYATGKYNKMLINAAEKYQEIQEFILKSLRDERRNTYSAFMPICNKTGKIMEEGVLEVHPQDEIIVYKNTVGETVEQKFTNGGAKLQWKVDLGMRWAAFGVDYEMYGKDVFENEPLYRGVCEILGYKAPINYCYEHFLDKDGKKISKSKGNGITVEEWFKYAPQESLEYYMYIKPKTAKRLYFDVIPRSVDEYIRYCKSYHIANDSAKVDNPIFYVHSGKVPEIKFDISFDLLINLASACNPDADSVMWGFIQKYDPKLYKGYDKFLDTLVKHSIIYYIDFIKPNKTYRKPNENEIHALNILIAKLQNISNEDDIQSIIYDASKEAGIESNDFFKALYEILLGTQNGPRFGSFIILYGVNEAISLIKSKCTI